MLCQMRRLIRSLAQEESCPMKGVKFHSFHNSNVHLNAPHVVVSYEMYAFFASSGNIGTRIPF